MAARKTVDLEEADRTRPLVMVKTKKGLYQSNSRFDSWLRDGEMKIASGEMK